METSAQHTWPGRDIFDQIANDPFQVRIKLPLLIQASNEAKTCYLSIESPFRF